MAVTAAIPTFSDSVEEELTRFRARRDSMRDERARLDRELATTDDMIAALTRLRPDLRMPSDAPQQHIGRTRTLDLGPALLHVLRSNPDRDLAVAEIMVRLANDAPGSIRKASTTQVRNALRYLAKHRTDISSSKDAENRLVYRFSIRSNPVSDNER
jgi:hypothetical protein